MDANVRAGRINSMTEHFVPDLRSAYHITFTHIRTVNAEWTFPSHEHKQYEINYVLKGTQILSINGQSYRQEAGDFVLIRPGDIHSSRVGSAEGLSYFCLHFELDDRPLLHLLRTTQLALIPADSPGGAALGPILDRLAELVGRGSGQRFDLSVRMRIQEGFFQIIAQLCEILSETKAIRDDKRPPRSETAHRIESLIQSAAKQPIYHGHPSEEKALIRQIARQLGISESHCNRLFKKVYGVSPRQYLSGIIREEAIRLLRDTTLSVDHISNLLGYADIAHFSRQFKRWTGESPRSYRGGQKEPLP